jgi:hypothetical protein
MGLPDRVSLELYTWHPLIKKDGLTSLLEAFESASDLAPTHWCSDDQEDPKAIYHLYTRDLFLAEVGTLGEYSDIPTLIRNKDSKYSVYLTNNGLNELSQVDIEFDEDSRIKDLHQIFAWGDVLASSVEAELAFLDPFWDSINYEYVHSRSLSTKEFQSCGLSSISARNWFGPHLVKLIGRDRLCDCGGHIQDTDWGGIRLDLVKDPWLADAEALSNAQKTVRQNLESTGVFGDFAKMLRFKAGEKWVPISKPVTSLRTE